MTLCFCRGMWRRRSWFSLNGKAGFQGQVRGKLLTSAHPPLPQATSMQHAAVGRYEHLIGSKLRGRNRPAQHGEVAIAVQVLNRMIRTAKPVSVRR